MSASKLTTAEFKLALAGDLPLLVDFYADWCGPCKMMAPVVEQIGVEQTGKVQVHSLDVDAEPEIAMQYLVMSIPTLALFKQGKLVNKLVGYPGPAGVKSWLAKNLA
jgi:thioredoxin 1